MQLAKEIIIRDTYDLGFMSLVRGCDERELEAALEQKMTCLLLELGKGLAFVVQQAEVVVSGKIRWADLLFCHILLRCYAVMELRGGSFEPEFAGKLNFYVITAKTSKNVNIYTY